MEEYLELTELAEWLDNGGHTRAWFARAVGYSYQQTWGKLTGRSPLNDNFVVACFEGVPDLPRDIFASHGYVREDGYVVKRIELESERAETNPA